MTITSIFMWFLEEKGYLFSTIGTQVLVVRCPGTAVTPSKRMTITVHDVHYLAGEPAFGEVGAVGASIVPYIHEVTLEMIPRLLDHEDMPSVCKEFLRWRLTNGL